MLGIVHNTADCFTNRQFIPMPKHDPGVVLARSHPLCMDSQKVGVVGKHEASLGRCDGQEDLIVDPTLATLLSGNHIHAAPA